MRIRYLIEALVIAAFLLTLPAGWPAVQAADPPSAVAQIRSASTSYLAALASGDADQIAAHWTPQGTFVDASNQSYQAQQLVQLEFPKNAAPQQHSNVGVQQTHVGARQSTIRLITPDVALEQAGASAYETDQTVSSVNSSSETSHVALWVRSEKRWLLDYLQEFQVPSQPFESRLAQLQWMVGQWEAESEGIVASLTVTWSDQRRYLMQKFTVQLADQDVLRVEQRIGWDAANKQIRSWLFRSDGGFAGGVWSLVGDTWIVKKSEVMPNGEKTNTVNLWVNDDADSCWFKSHHDTVEDRSAEDLILQFRRTVSP